MTNIYSDEELLKFYNTFFSNTDPFLTDFFCVAARKKYMTEEQKKNINLGDTCMMQKTIIKEYDPKKFLAKVHQVDASLDYFTDRDGNYLPRSCMTFYMNINRTNLLSAVKDFKDLMNIWEYDLLSLLQFSNENKKQNIGKQLKTIQNNLLKSFQDPKNVIVNYFDIDCDIGRNFSATEYKEKLVDFLQSENVYILSTHSGCHVIFPKIVFSDYNKKLSASVSKTEMKNKVLNPERMYHFVCDMMSDKNIKEIKYNQNMAVPMPGTTVNGFEIKMI